MRFQCEFCKCCPRHIGSTNELCRACGHGACWHRRVEQFGSVRELAHRPSYQRERVQPMVPELPEVFEYLTSHACPHPEPESELPYSPCVMELPV